MKSDDIFTSPNMAKSDLLCLAFSVVCFVLQQKLYEKIALTERKLLICKTCLWMLYFLIWHMKSDDIFTSANMAKLTYFALHFQLCVLYCNRNYMKRLLSLRETFWYAKHVCRLCICLPHIWRVMTFLHLLILPKVTYFALHFQLCVLYCKKIIWKDCSHREEAFDMQNMSVDAVFPYLTYEKWWHFYICKYGKKWHILPCIFSCVCCTATEIIWKDCSHWEKPFDMQNMCADCVFAYLTIWRVMTFLHLPIWQKVTYFSLHFQLCVLYWNKNYMKRLLSQRRSFWYTKHVCRCCISWFDIWKVMTFLYLKIWQQMTYFALYFQLCVLYCNRNYVKRLLSLRETFWYATHRCRLCICLSHIWRVMTFLHVLIWQKVTYFALPFQLCVLYCNRNYMKRLLSQRRSFWYAKHVCRCCISLFDIWKVMTFLYMPIWQKMTYFALYF